MHDLTAHPQPPAGYVVDSENVAEMARYNLLVTQAMRQQGQCFAPLGEQCGIAALHQHLFRQAGFQLVAEMHAEDFCAAAFFQRVWGYKPA